MELSFLTPLGGLVALAALIPLAVWRSRERRARSLRQTLRLPEPTPRSRFALVGALAGVCALLGLAATQPVVATTRTQPERTDAQIFVVMDTSRSMMASAAPGEPTRFDRARAIAISLRNALPEVPMGVASSTSQVLPHLFPTTDRRVFESTLEDSIDIERPPPNYSASLATALQGLDAVPTKNYFPRSAEERVLVVLTDGETQPLESPSDLSSAFDQEPVVETVVVRLWDEEERIFETGAAEVGYRPIVGSDAQLEEIASLMDAEVLSESEAGRLPELVAAAVGEGPTTTREHEGRRRALMPWITLLAVFPLGFVLFRRNV
jgi:von Willebrand factor type A domain